MSLYKQFKMDETKEAEGVEIKYGPNDDNTVPTFRIRRRSAQNQQYAKTLDRESGPYRRMIELNTLDDKISNRIVMRTFCQSILIGWENVYNQQNQPIAFNFDNAMKLFGELPELYEELQSQSAKASLFRDDTMESDAKNS